MFEILRPTFTKQDVLYGLKCGFTGAVAFTALNTDLLDAAMPSVKGTVFKARVFDASTLNNKQPVTLFRSSDQNGQIKYQAVVPCKDVMGAKSDNLIAHFMKEMNYNVEARAADQGLRNYMQQEMEVSIAGAKNDCKTKWVQPIAWKRDIDMRIKKKSEHPASILAVPYPTFKADSYLNRPEHSI